MVAPLVNQVSDITDNQIGSGLYNAFIFKRIAILQGDRTVAKDDSLVSQFPNAVKRHIA